MDYNEVYQALKSPRSMDPFMGMQLGAVRLPPSFSFNGSNNTFHSKQSAHNEPFSRYQTRSDNRTNLLIIHFKI